MITPIGPFGPNAELASAQITAIDSNAAAGLDRRVSQSDNLESTITVTADGTIIWANGSQMHGAISTPSEVVWTGVGARYSSGAYLKFSTTSYLQLNGAGNYIDCLGGSQIKVEPSATIELITGSPGGGINVNSGGFITVMSGSLITVASGGEILAQTGSGIVAQSGSTVTLASATTISGTLTQSGATTRTGSETNSGTGAWTAKRYHALTTSTPQSLTLTDNDYWQVATALGANQTLNIADGTVVGQHARLIRVGSPDAHSCTINVTGIAYTFPNSAACFLHLIWSGATWLPVDASPATLESGSPVFN